MNSDKYPNIYSHLENILDSDSTKINHWIDYVIEPQLPIHELEKCLSKKPKVLLRVLECIVLESRKMVGIKDTDYLFRPRSFELIGVVRSDGSFQINVITSCAVLDVNNTIDFIAIDQFLTTNLDKAMFKSISFFYTLTPEELDDTYRKHPNLKKRLEMERDYLKKHGLEDAPNIFDINPTLPSQLPLKPTSQINTVPNSARAHEFAPAPAPKPTPTPTPAPDETTKPAPDETTKPTPDETTKPAPDETTITSPIDIPSNIDNESTDNISIRDKLLSAIFGKDPQDSTVVVGK